MKKQNEVKVLKKVRPAKAYFVYSIGNGFLLSDGSTPRFGYGESMMVFDRRQKARFAIDFLKNIYPDYMMDIVGKIG